MRSSCINRTLKKLAVVLLLNLSAFSICIRAQDDAIRVNTELVIIPTTVLDGSGRYVTALKREDFRIVENGVEQETALFEPTGKPVSVLLLVDRSGSMNESSRAVNKAVNLFIKHLRADDLLIIATFAAKPDVLFQPVRVGDIRGDVDLTDISGKGRVRIKGASKHAIELMRNRIGGRKSIVLFSDGIVQSEERPTADLLIAEAKDTTVHTIQLEYSINPNLADDSRQYLRNLTDKATEFMRDLAEKSGGRYYKISAEQSIEKIFVEMASELEHQYNLGYYSQQTEQKPQIRRIKITVKQPSLTVRAREYYTTKEF